MIAYPEFLPEPQRDGYGFQPVSPMARSELQSGRARQRRRFTSVPTVASVTWLMDDGEAQLFEGGLNTSCCRAACGFNAHSKRRWTWMNTARDSLISTRGRFWSVRAFGALPRSLNCSSGRFWMPNGSSRCRTTSLWLTSSISP